MRYLSKINVKNFKIICPLSYGPPNYINRVVHEGERLFGENFIPLLSFLEPEIYYHILNQIDLAIMYHNRQQAIGNIILLIYLGKPLCMKKTSTFNYIKELGISIYSTKDFDKLLKGEMEFTEEMAKSNRKVILQNFTEQSTANSIRNLFNFVENITDIKKG